MIAGLLNFSDILLVWTVTSKSTAMGGNVMITVSRQQKGEVRVKLKKKIHTKKLLQI